MFDAQWYQSVAGVAAVSVLAAQFVKKQFVEVEYLNRFPLVVYVLVFAALGTWFSNGVLGTLAGDSFAQVATDVVTSALLAIGGFEAVTNLAKPLADTGMPKMPRSAFGAPKKFMAAFLAVSMLTSACATRNGVQVSPEGTLALRANQLVQALRTLTTPAGTSPIEQLVASKTLTVPDALRVAEAIKATMVYSQDLATVLKVVDEAKTEAERTMGLQRAAILVQQIQKGLSSAVVSVGTEPGRKAVVQALEVATQILLTVGSLFPAPTAVS